MSDYLKSLRYRGEIASRLAHEKIWIDSVKAVDIVDRLEAAESESDSLKQAISTCLPCSYYMDPPDGGNVELTEQLARMAQDAARYRRIRNGPYSDRHGDVYAMTFQPDGDQPIDGAELDSFVDAAMAQRRGTK